MDPITIWPKNNKFTVSRSSNATNDSWLCNVNWALASHTDCGKYIINIGGYISKNDANVSLIVVESATKHLNKNQSFELGSYFTESEHVVVINWNCVDKSFTQYDLNEDPKTTFPFPIEGVEALVKDMGDLLKELKWV